jgi:hypothetical protein
MSKRRVPKVPVRLELSADQEARAQELARLIAAKTQEEILRMTRLLVSKQDHELFGETEFQIRDIVHQIGAHALQAAANQRKKGGTRGPA